MGLVEIEVCSTPDSDSTLELESHFDFDLSARTDPNRVVYTWAKKERKKLSPPIKKVAWATVLEKVEYTEEDDGDKDDDEDNEDDKPTLESDEDELFTEKTVQTPSPEQDSVKMKGKEAFRQYISQKYVNQTERYIFSSLDRPVCVPFNGEK